MEVRLLWLATLNLLLVLLLFSQQAHTKGGVRIGRISFGRSSGGGGRGGSGGRVSSGMFSGARVRVSTTRFRARRFSSSGGGSSGSSSGKGFTPMKKWSTALGTSRRPFFRSKVGYGTRWGTRFPHGHGRYEKIRNSRKLVGLGVGAGFIGGTTVMESAGDIERFETLGIYHRYLAAWEISYKRGLVRNFDQRYYNTYYRNNTCDQSCPEHSHCAYGVCRCDGGYDQLRGKCVSKMVSSGFGGLAFAFGLQACKGDTDCILQIDDIPKDRCHNSDECQKRDNNLLCGSRKRVCHCREWMKWNDRDAECQLYINVNCSPYSYDTPMSFGVMQAVRRAEEAVGSNGYVDIPFTPNITWTPEMALKNSLLLYINQSDNLRDDDLVEAFCRDVDSFVYELNTADGRPDTCPPLSRMVCATVYDSHDCSGGWSLEIPQGNMSFPYFSRYWRYRNDIDTVGVRKGCELQVFTDTDFEGDSAIFDTRHRDGWWVLQDNEQLELFENNIESIKCKCWQ